MLLNLLLLSDEQIGLIVAVVLTGAIILLAITLYGGYDVKFKTLHTPCINGTFR